jgi:branched-chain amino acid aminotransferase
VTPPLTDTILDGVTRDSLLVLAADAGIRVEERPVSVTELRTGLVSGYVSEAFGAGTGAVISPIATIGVDGIDFDLRGGGLGARLKRELDDIRYGRKPDTYGWNYFV